MNTNIWVHLKHVGIMSARMFGILLDLFINRPVLAQTALLKQVVGVWKTVNIAKQMKRTVSQALD